MTQKGIATSTIIYMMIIVFAGLIFSSVAISSSNTKASKAILERVEDFLGDPTISLGLYGAYNNHVLMTIPAAKVDSDLTQLPLTIILDATNASAIFTELGENYQRLAVVQSDLETELYVEVEYWDGASQKAVLHASRDNFVLSSSQDTEVYLFYDAAADDNSTYVGDNGSVVGENVWDSNYIMVLHMGSSLVDSTSNNNDPVANSTTVADGLYGKSRVFATGKSITVTANGNGTFSNQNFTNTFLYKTTASAGYNVLWSYDYTSHVAPFYSQQHRLTDNITAIFSFNLSGTYTPLAAGVTVSNNEWHAGTWSFTSGSQKMISDQTAVIDETSSGTITYYNQEVWIGNSNYGGGFTGNIGEVRISDVKRIDDWTETEHDSLMNTLITYTAGE